MSKIKKTMSNESNIKTILITGVAGFIASNFASYMVIKYPNINFICIDKLNYCSDLRNIENIKDLSNFTFIQCDICDKEKINEIFCKYKFEVVFHFAAYTHVYHSFDNSFEFTKNNIHATHILLEESKKIGIQKFIYISTDEVYGPTNSIVDEKNILNPTNPYSSSKAAAEHLVNSYYYSYKLPIIITRGNNVYGKNQYPDKVIPLFSIRLLNGLKCEIQGSGLQKRSFLYIDDAVRAFDTIFSKGLIGEIYNIGTEKEIKIIDLAHMMMDIIKPEECHDNLIEYIKDRNFNDSEYNISSDKLKALGWEEKISFKDGLKLTIDWYYRETYRWFNSLDIFKCQRDEFRSIEKSIIKSINSSEYKKAITLYEQLNKTFKHKLSSSDLLPLKCLLIKCYDFVGNIKLGYDLTSDIANSDASNNIYLEKIIEKNNDYFNIWKGKQEVKVYKVNTLDKDKIVNFIGSKTNEKIIIIGPYRYDNKSLFCEKNIIVFRHFRDIKLIELSLNLGEISEIDDRSIQHQLVIGVMSCCDIQKYRDQKSACQRTWCNKTYDSNIPTHFFTGEFCGDIKCDPDDHSTVHLEGVKNDYLSSTYKQYFGLKWMYEKYPNSKFYFMIGTDTYINIEKILKWLDEFNSGEKLYLGGDGEYRDIFDSDGHHNLYYHSGGSGFILSNATMKIIYPYLDKLIDQWFNLCKSDVRQSYLYNACDASMGYFLYKNNWAKTIMTDKFRGCNWKGYVGETKCFKNCEDIVPYQNLLSCHYMTPTDMDEIYKLT